MFLHIGQNTSVPNVTGNTDYDVGQTISLTCSFTVNGGATLTVKWFKDGQELLSQTATTFTKTAAKEDAGGYRCVVTSDIQRDANAVTVNIFCKLQSVFRNAKVNLTSFRLSFS